MRFQRQMAVDALYLLTESVVWFMAIRLMVTSMERSFLNEVSRRLDLAVRAGDLRDVGLAEQVVASMGEASRDVYGPAFIFIVLGAAGGFLLMRGVNRAGFSEGLGSLALIFGTVLGMNVLLHLSLAGSLRFWDPSGAVLFLQDPSRQFTGQIDLATFVRSPGLGMPHGAAVSASFFGLTLLWFRFMIAGRSTVSFDRVLRSFGLAFLASLILVVLARLEGMEGLGRFAIPHFILGMLTLAVANYARAVPAEGVRRPGAWATAVVGTVATLAAVAVLLGLAAFLNIGAILSVIGTIAFRILEVVLIIVITPFYWVLDRIFQFFFPEGFAGVAGDILEIRPLSEDLEQIENEESTFPGWIANSLKFIATVVVGYVMYRIGRLLVAARRKLEPPVGEVRTRSTGGAGLGQLLRDLLPRSRARASTAWMAAHPVYALYGRTLQDADERGLPRLPGETPVEFASTASSMMGATSFVPVAEAFDRARYGRHFPDRSDVAEMAREITAWEAEVPPTPELRERLAGARPMAEDRAFELQMTLAKRQSRGEPSPIPPEFE